MENHHKDPKITEEKMLKSSSSLSWDGLPDDLWVEIFKRTVKSGRISLGQLSLVSKRFLTLSNRSLTSFIFFPTTNKKIEPSTFFSRFCFINTITFYTSHGRADFAQDAIIDQLALSNLPLQSLHMYSRTHFPAEAMRNLGSNMRKTLRSLSCTYFDVLTDNDLAVVADSFSYLHELNIEYPRKSHVTDKGILAIATQLRGLVSLNITRHKNISHKAFEYLASNCRLLGSLATEFYGYNCISCLDHILYLKSLTSLQLSGEKISKSLLAQILRADLKLEKLGLEFYDSTGDIDGAYLCGFLKSLTLLRNLQLTGAFPFPAGMQAGDFAAAIPNVHEIRLSTHIWSNHYAPPGIFFHLMKSCRLLKDIDVACDNLNQKWLSIPGPLLVERLSFDSCRLCDETLMLIASLCPKLNFFSISESSYITQNGIKAMVARYPNIKFVDASNCCDRRISFWDFKLP